MLYVFCRLCSFGLVLHRGIGRFRLLVVFSILRCWGLTVLICCGCWCLLSFGLVLCREIGRSRLLVLLSASVSCLVGLFLARFSRLGGCCLDVAVEPVTGLRARVGLDRVFGGYRLFCLFLGCCADG